MKQKRIEMYLTWKCTNDCLFCIEYERKKRFWDKKISLETVENLLKKEAAGGANHVTFLGGEPTLHPEFLKILASARDLGFKTSITTNGVLFSSEEYARKASQLLDEIVVSVHGHDKITHEANTQRQGSFGILLKALGNISKYFEDKRTNTVISRFNYRSLAGIVRLADRFGIKKMTLSALEPPAEKDFSKARLARIAAAVPPLAEVGPHLFRAIELAEARGIHLRVADIPFCELKDYYLKASDLFYTNRIKISSNNRRLDRRFVAPRRRAKVKKCAGCPFDKLCSGYLEGYLKIFPHEN